MTLSESNVQAAYDLARERYAALGVDTATALARLETIAISLHCWQGDDVGGFENPGGDLTGGIAATGNYPGKARTAEELRSDLDVVYGLLPGSHRLNLHAIYLESDQNVERNAIEPRHFSAWKDWAKANQLGIDFNPTCFSHPKSRDGFTLAHQDKGIRQFWIERFAESFPWRSPIRRAVLVSIRDPDVCHCSRSQLLSEVLTNPAAGNTVLDPELTNAFVAMGERKPVGRPGMRETSGVEIDAVTICLRPILPAGEVARLDGVALHFFIRLQINRVEIQPV